MLIEYWMYIWFTIESKSICIWFPFDLYSICIQFNSIKCVFDFKLNIVSRKKSLDKRNLEKKGLDKRKSNKPKNMSKQLKNYALTRESSGTKQRKGTGFLIHYFLLS